jgi:hypothetical protein
MTPPTSADAEATTVDQKAVDFVRRGFAGASLQFTVQCANLATFRECVWNMGGYFDPATVADLLSGVLAECGSSVEVGREYSPVMYVHVPFHTNQRMARDVRQEDGQPISEDDRVTLAARIMQAGHQAGADEVDVKLVPADAGPVLGNAVRCVRLWWD